MPPDKVETKSAVPYSLLMSIQNGTMEYRYRGVPTLKNPFDMALYPLLLEELRPKTLLEIGSHLGGSALWFSDVATNLGLSMDVYSIDVVPVVNLNHSNITFLKGDARKLADTLSSEFLSKLPHPWLVIEDADHHYRTTIATLQFFDHWLMAGDYLVVEDGILSDMRVAKNYDGGPSRAIEEFLRERNDSYAVDRRYCDYFGKNVTWNVNGYLRREK